MPAPPFRRVEKAGSSPCHARFEPNPDGPVVLMPRPHVQFPSLPGPGPPEYLPTRRVPDRAEGDPRKGLPSPSRSRWRPERLQDCYLSIGDGRFRLAGKSYILPGVPSTESDKVAGPRSPQIQIG
jgi:hypothetical protein